MPELVTMDILVDLLSSCEFSILVMYGAALHVVLVWGTEVFTFTVCIVLSCIKMLILSGNRGEVLGFAWDFIVHFKAFSRRRSSFGRLSKKKQKTG